MKKRKRRTKFIYSLYCPPYSSDESIRIHKLGKRGRVFVSETSAEIKFTQKQLKEFWKSINNE